MTTDTRRFVVHAGHVDRHHSRVVQEVTFEAAAIAYAEGLHTLPDGEDEISVIVRDAESGREHCFRIDVATGATSACG